MAMKRLRRLALDPIIGFGIHFLIAIVSRLSHRNLERLASFLSPLVAAVYPEGRKLVVANLRIVFPDWPEARYVATYKECVRHSLDTFFRFLWFYRHPGELSGVLDRTSQAATDVLELSHSPNGAILISPHLGKFDLVAQCVASWGVDLHAVVHELRNPWAEAVAVKGRECHGLTVIPQHGAVRQMVKAMRAGKPVAILMDQNVRPHKGGVFTDFFGLPVTVSRVPAALALRLKAPLFVGACVQDGPGLVFVGRKVPLPASETCSEETLTHELMAVHEELIRRYPEQYAWIYKRWRYIPGDAPPEVAARYPYYAKVYVHPRAEDRQAGDTDEDAESSS